MTDNDGHGTHVAGIIGAAGDNGQGVAGLAWGVKLMPLQDGRSLFSVVDAMEYAIHYRPSPDDGSRVRVINMSLGFSSGGVSYLFADALADAHDAGVTVTVSAGNDGAGVVEYPAATPGALAVGATAQALFWEHLASFSNFGDRLDLVAPGEHILSTLPTGRKDDAGKDLPAYGFESGTSMAAPYVAGVVALLAARYDPNNQHLDANFADQVRQRLVDSADDLGTPGWDPLFGAGRVNAGRAVAPATLDAAP